MAFPDDKLIFVGGVPRSGTTLVQNILDSHPKIVGGPEFTFIPNIIQLRRKLFSSIEEGQTSFYIDKAIVDVHVADLIKGLLANRFCGQSDVYLSEKTPWNILVFKDLVELLPTAKFIYVVRHPYDVYKSMVRVRERAIQNKIEAPDFVADVLKTCYYIESVFHAIDRLNSEYGGRIFTLKYEDVLVDAELATKRLCGYLHIDWHPNMLTPGEFQHPGEGPTVNGVWYTRNDYQKNIDRAKFNSFSPSDIDPLDKRVLDLVFERSAFSKAFSYGFERTFIGFFDRRIALRMYKEYKKKFNPSEETQIRVL